MNVLLNARKVDLDEPTQEEIVNGIALFFQTKTRAILFSSMDDAFVTLTPQPCCPNRRPYNKMWAY